jgi:hypothetical protein
MPSVLSYPSLSACRLGRDWHGRSVPPRTARHLERLEGGLLVTRDMTSVGWERM